MSREIKQQLKEMTLEEKATLVNGATFFGTADFPEFGIERLQLLDGGTGINFEQLFGDFCSADKSMDSTNGMIGSEALGHVIDWFYEPEKLSEAELALYHWIKEKMDQWTDMPELAPGCFPPGMLLGATFNPEVVGKVGEALGLEAQAYKIDILLGSPNVNIMRDPLNGRLFEGYSEDPYLVSALAPELVKGVQKYPVAANVKHFAANNQETNRIGINETISKRALEEIYLPGFKACVEKGKVRTVMSAYNQINHIACTENKWLLQDILRKEWGFDGFVLSDWGAVYHPVEAVAAGNDLAMPGPIDGKPIVDAVRRGSLPEQALDEACSNILRFMDWLKEKKRQAEPIRMTAGELMNQTDKAAYDAAAEGIVLLKNTNNIFPILPESDCRITLVGSGCERILTCGSGSAGITTNRNTSLVQELRKILGEDKVNVYSKDSMLPLTRNALCSTGFGQDEIVLVVASLSGMEGNDRRDMDMSEFDCEILNNLIGMRKEEKAAFKIGLLINACGPVALEEFEPYVDGIFCIFLPGMQGGRAMADLLTGRRNPSGKLPLTFPKRYEDTPTFLNFPGDGGEVTYGEGIYVGYRYYDKKKIKPQYAFGYGLSYTDFAVRDICVDKDVFSDNVRISGRLKNEGKIAGAEVIQLYISDVTSSHSKPVKELKKFQKIFLLPGKEEEFVFELSEQDFAYFDTDYDRFLVEEGFYDLIIATSSRREDVIAKKRVYFQCESPYSYGMNSTIKVFYENKELKRLLLDWWIQEGLDKGILESNYQYTNSRKLYEIIPKHLDLNPESNEKFKIFIESIRKVVKP